MQKFTHLHVHSHYSILDGMSKVPELISRAKETGMYSMALTDHGNMFGIKDLMDSSKKTNEKTESKIKELKGFLSEAEKFKEKEANQEEITDEEREKFSEDKIATACEELEIEKSHIFKPIIGIETYCAPVSIHKRDGREDRGWHLILLAKNKTGYQSLCKIASIAYTEGFYYNPRIDHSILEQYKDGLIVSSACLGGEIPQKIMNGDIEGAEESIRWFKSIWGDDYYLELQRHKTDKPNAAYDTYYKQEEVNQVLLQLAKKYDIKVIATNDVHFVLEDHGEAHDRLVCLSTGRDFDDPTRLHYTKQEWLKSPEEMEAIFSDIPEALSNTQEIVDKCEFYDIDSGPIMPKFPIPEEFGTEEEYKNKFTDEDLFNEFTRNEKGEVVLSEDEAKKKIKKLGGYEKLYRIKLEADYLAKLAWEGAKMRYGENLTEEQIERITFELHIMKTMGFPGYFLIVQDYIRGAREELGVSVGPGRGSAAGSVVAYCLKITDLDPLKYDLLFERFLNPDRISLPDIDVDFDDDGRGKVLDWVTKKYGKEKVAHIITYGTMAAKSSIADVSRVQKIPLDVVSKIKAYIPDRGFDESTVMKIDNLKEAPSKMPKVNLKNCYKYISDLHELAGGAPNEEIGVKEDSIENVSSMLKYAQELEDTNRQIGIHACGVIIGADDLTKFAPMCAIKDKDTKEDVVVTQYDGHVIESVGLIKMDFLGLSTLSIIKEALKNIKKSRGIDIDIDKIPIDDPKTYELYQKGHTIAIFQFESPGMQKYLRELQPTVIGDIIAMNALYRPGPMDYIPQFINRKQGREPITYPLPCMEKYLKDTYGITVYQEQVMLLSREIADFTRGESDTLRKAMGKKQIAKMEELYGKFMEQGIKKQVTENKKAIENGTLPKEKALDEEGVRKILQNIWDDWKKFASYAFNKSHAACYAWVSYQTAYLKAHFPAEFMAANLTRGKDDITEVTKLMNECHSQRINVLLPDVNESDLHFTVNAKGDIRFGLGGIKGVGEGAVESIIRERQKHGIYKDIFDFVSRVSLTSVNRKTIESLIYAGAFDSFETSTRDQLLYIAPNGETFLEQLMKFGNAIQSDKPGLNLFGDSLAIEVKRPELIHGEINNFDLLDREKEVIGMYLSGHPLDTFKHIIEQKPHTPITQIEEVLAKAGKCTIIGIITQCEILQTRTGTEFGKATLLDYSGNTQMSFFGKNFIEKKNYLNNRYIIEVEITRKKFKSTKEDGKKVEVESVRDYANIIGAINDENIEKIKAVNLYMFAKDVNEKFVNEIQEVAKNNKGKTNLYINLLINDYKYLTLKSEKYKISYTKEFADFIDSTPEIRKKTIIF